MNDTAKLESNVMAMATCFVLGVECGTFWDAVGAVATSAATLVALGSSYLAVSAPKRERARDRLEATQEVLRAADETLALFYEACDRMNEGVWGDDYVRYLRMRARHLGVAIDRLIERPVLTDGAIAVGAGAISILDMLGNELPLQGELPPIRGIRGGAVLQRSTKEPAKLALAQANPAVDVMTERMKKVRAYANIPKPV